MNFGQNSFRFLYYRFKDSASYPLSLVTVIVVVCLLLLFKVIVPQIGSWFSIRNEIDATSRRIDILKGNINFMNNLDRGQLATDLDIATAGLPPVKDFGGILNAISASAIKAGVSLEDYSFQVGNVSTGSASLLAEKKAQQPNGLSTVKLAVTITGSITGMRNFLKEIEEKLPIGEIVTLESSDKTTTIDIQFYEKAIPKIALQDEQSVSPVSNTNRLLLQRLASWKSSSEAIDRGLNTPAASSGAVPLF